MRNDVVYQELCQLVQKGVRDILRDLELTKILLADLEIVNGYLWYCERL